MGMQLVAVTEFSNLNKGCYGGATVVTWAWEVTCERVMLMGSHLTLCFIEYTGMLHVIKVWRFTFNNSWLDPVLNFYEPTNKTVKCEESSGKVSWPLFIVGDLKWIIDRVMQL